MEASILPASMMTTLRPFPSACSSQPPPLVLGVACRSPCLSLAGFSDAAKQDAACTPLTVTPLPPLLPFIAALHLPRPLPGRPAPSLSSYPVPLSPSGLSLSPINKIAHLPRKLIARLNFSRGRLFRPRTPAATAATVRPRLSERATRNVFRGRAKCPSTISVRMRFQYVSMIDARSETRSFLQVQKYQCLDTIIIILALSYILEGTR